MGNMVKHLKKTWLRGMEVVGNTASSIAENAKYRVNEMNLETRRREILADFGSIAYEMWQRGESFPPVLEAQLKQLNALDEQLIAIRAQRYAAAKEASIAKEEADAAAREADMYVSAGTENESTETETEESQPDPEPLLAAEEQGEADEDHKDG